MSKRAAFDLRTRDHRILTLFLKTIVRLFLIIVARVWPRGRLFARSQQVRPLAVPVNPTFTQPTHSLDMYASTTVCEFVHNQMGLRPYPNHCTHRPTTTLISLVATRTRNLYHWCHLCVPRWIDIELHQGIL